MLQRPFPFRKQQNLLVSASSSQGSGVVGPVIWSKTTPWTPSQLTTALWLDAQDPATLTVSNLQVSQWNDKSGNGRNATQATSANQPSYFRYQNLATYSETFTNAVWAQARVSVLQNLVLRSQEFETASWNRNAITVGTNATTAPDGTTTAESLTETATTNPHITWQVGFYAANRYTFSVYIKPNGRDFAFVRFVVGVSDWAGVLVTMSTLTGTTQTSGTAFSNLSYTITDAGNGWVRVSLTATASSTISDAGVGLSNSATPTYGAYGDVSYAGDATKGIYIWGAQMVRGALPQTYTPTTTAAATIFFTDPIAGTAAQKIVEGTNATNTFTLRENVSGANGQYTASFYLKAAERTNCAIGMSDNATGDVLAIFNLSNGTLVTSSSGGSWSGLSTSITSAGSGWYRVALTATRGAGTLTTPYVQMVQSGTTTVYTGDGESGVYVWGGQLNSGALQPYQQTLADRSAGGINNYQSIGFNADFLGTTYNINRTSVPNVAVFLVYRNDAEASAATLWGSENGNWDRAQLLYQSAGSGLNYAVTTGSTGVQVTGMNNFIPHVYSSQFRVGVTNGSNVWIDGTVGVTFSEVLGDAHENLGICADSAAGGRAATATVGEFIVVADALSTDNRQKMEGYLAWKWGLQANLPVSHPYYSAPPLA